MIEDEYLQRLEDCLLLADVAPTEHVRATLLRMARHCEIEARPIKLSAVQLSESRTAIAKANALLGVAQDSTTNGAGSLPAAPCPATTGQVQDTSFAAHHR